MQKTAPKELSINLLPVSDKTSPSGVFQTASSYAKFLLQVLNIIAAIALFIHLMLVVSFALSYQRIKDNLTSISESQTVETGVNEIASRLKFVKEVKAQSNAFSAAENANTIVPEGLTLTELRIESDKLVVKGETLDVRSLTQMAALVKNSKYFTNFNVTQITVPGANSSNYIIGATVDIK